MKGSPLQCVRALACAGRVAELNPYVSVAVLTHALNEHADLSYLSQFQVYTFKAIGSLSYVNVSSTCAVCLETLKLYRCAPYISDFCIFVHTTYLLYAYLSVCSSSLSTVLSNSFGPDFFICSAC